MLKLFGSRKLIGEVVGSSARHTGTSSAPAPMKSREPG